MPEIDESIIIGNLQPDPVDERDWVSGAVTGAIELPAKLDNRSLCTPVRNQGSRGTCVAHATCGVQEIFDKEDFSRDIDLSEEFVFTNCKKIDIEDYNYSGWGSFMRSGAKSITNFGACLESTMPYNPNAPEDTWKTNGGKMTPEIDAEARQFKSSAYISVATRLNELKKAVFQHKAVMGGFKLYESYRNAKTNGGFLPVPNTETEGVIGGHAMAIVGYDDEKQHFIVRNSWSASWGDNGYIYIPYAYCTPDLMYSFWAFVDLDSAVFDAEAAIADLVSRGVTGKAALIRAKAMQDAFNAKKTGQF